MPKQLHLTCLIDLPDDVFAASDIVIKCGEPWQSLLDGLTEASVKHAHTSETIETRAKPATNGTRAPRRTKAQIAADKAAALNTAAPERESLV